jgi:hypothetical protein
MPRLTIFAAFFLAVLLVSLPVLAQDVISTAIGGGPNNVPAIDANLYNPYGVAVDSSGNYYISGYNQNRVFKVNATTKVITVVAGSGAQGYSGDGVVGGAGNASLNRPFGVAVDSAGNVYIADNGNCVIREVTTAATISTIAGTAGSCGFAGDGGKATSADISSPIGVAVDSADNVYIGDDSNCVVREVTKSTGDINTVAGDHTLGCGWGGDGGKATSAQLSTVSGVAVDTAGDLFIVDLGNCLIRKVTKSTGDISTVAGDHAIGCGYSGDGGAATSAQISQLDGIAVNGAGTTVIIADYNNQRIRQFTVGGNINTIAGNGTACGYPSTCGEGGAATSAELDYPTGIAVTSGGTYYIGNNDNYVVDSFTVGGDLNVVAGNHSYSTETLITGAAADGVSLNYPFGLATDTSNNVYIADSHNYMVREYVKATGLVNFFAGTGTSGFTGDGGAATSAELNTDYGVAKDSSGNVYVADTYNCLIREVNTGGTINLFAGLVISNSPRCGFSGDGGPDTSAELYYPDGVAVDNKANVYVADTSNEVVRKINGGTITTIAGIGGINGYAGDGGPATNALLYNPEAVAVDPAGNVFIADYDNCRVREINATTGIINTVAGNGNCAFTGDGVATDNGIEYPQGVAVDANDNLFISDYSNRVRWVSPSGIMTTIAGNGASNYYGDSGPATAAALNEPTGIVLDSSGDIFVSDYGNFRVREITAFPALGTNVGSLAFGLTSVGSSSSPLSVTVSAYGPVTVSNISTSGAFSEADDCPASMTNGSTCAMYVYFVPTASGTANGSVTIVSNGFFNPINTVNLTGLGSAISLSGSPLSFGNEIVKSTSAAQSVTVKNNGTSAVTMGAITLTNTTDYKLSTNTCPASGKTLAGAATCTIGVEFDPQSTGAKRGSVVINDSDPSSPQLIGLSGTGTSNVQLSPTSVTFATTAVGVTSGATKITLTNATGGNVTLGATPVTLTGPFVNDTGVTTCTADLIVANKGTCVIGVQFKPTALGYAAGLLTVSDSDTTQSQTVALQGSGTAVKFTPGAVNLSETVGSQAYTTVTITNVGTKPVTFQGGEISGAASADWSISGGDSAPCGDGSYSPLQPGKTCSITVYFTPSKTGARDAVYKLFDNSVGSPQTLTLTGTGT